MVSGLFVLAVLVRMLPSASLTSGAIPLFFGYDAYYHLRRIEHALLDFPHVLSFDPYLNFPAGGEPIWPPLFDGLLALLLLPVYAVSGMDGVEHTALWIPPIVGGLCVVATFAITREFLGWRCALAAGLILVLLSAHTWYSQAGFLDHHCAVALAATLLLWATARQIAMPLRGANKAPRRNAIAVGVLAAGALLLWPGALLFVAIAEFALFLHCTTAPTREEAVRAAGDLSVTNAVACLCIAPFGLASTWTEWGSMSPVVISHFQPWAFATLWVCAWACRLAYGRTRSLGARFGAAAAIAVAVTALSLLMLPALLEGAADAWQWITRDESFQQTVSESAPLFVTEGRFDLSAARKRLSDFVFLFPLALVGLVRLRHRTRSARATLFVAACALTLAVVTLVQRRFFNELAPLFAIVCGWGLVQAGAWLRAAGAGRIAATTLAGVAAFGLLWPSVRELQFPIERQIERMSGEPVLLRPKEYRKRAIVRAAHWLRASSPTPANWNDDGARPSYGVIADWGLGHALLYESQRPTVVGNFGDDVGSENLERVSAYFEAAETRALEIASEVRARYVVSAVQFRDGDRAGDPRSMRSLLAASNTTRDGLAHHRLVYQSPTRRKGGQPMVQIYEVLRGVEVIGRAAPEALVRGSITLQPNEQKPLEMHYATRASEAGEYRMRVAYATGLGGAVATGSHFRLESDGRSTELEIPEAATRDGLVVPAPAMR